MADEASATGLSRRELLERGGGAAIVLGGLAGAIPHASQAATPRPRRGGTLRVGLAGGGASGERLDPNFGNVNRIELARHRNVFEELATIDGPSGAAKLVLAESMEANAKATEWEITLRKDVRFHDGTPLTSDDVIWTFKRILSPKSGLSSARENIPMIDPKGIRRVNARTIRMKLLFPWSELPAAVGTRFAFIGKSGTTSYTKDNMIGTGPFEFESWVPGQRTVLTRNADHWQANKIYLDRVELIGLNDSVTRLNALLAKQVHCGELIDPAQRNVLKRRGLNELVTPPGGWNPICMNTQVEPFKDPRVREAMRLLANRPKITSVALQGLGKVGNDLFAVKDPLYASDIPQRRFDPERAKALLKRAGMDKQEFTLHSSDYNPNMLNGALAFSETARKNGVNVTVQKHPADGYFSDVYGKVSFLTSNWSYRPFLSQWVQCFSAYNKEETNWNNPEAERAIQRTAASVKRGPRKSNARRAQQLSWDQGGYIVWGFVQLVDGLQRNVHGFVPHVQGSLGFYTFKGVWLD